MANFYDVNAAIAKPSMFEAMQQGAQFGQQQRALREQRADQQQLRTLAPQIQQGDVGAFRQASAIDPKAASAQLSAGDLVTRRMEPLVRLLEEADARNPQEAQALWQSQGVPFMRQFSQGSEPTTDWQQAKPMLAQLKAKIEMAKVSGAAADPTGFRETHLSALAAGHKTGTQGYQDFFRRKGGEIPRAVTGARKSVMIRGSDGFERPGVYDPSQPYGYSIYDESVGGFRPLEAGETPTEDAAQGMAPPMGGAPAVLGGSALNQAVEQVESGGNPYAVSPKGAVGPMQTMPGTLRAPGFGVTPAKNASIDEQRRVGQDYLAALTQQYGQVGGLAAYNWGPGNWEAALQRSGGDPQRALSMAPPETQAYVPKVLAQVQGRRTAAPASLAVGRPPEQQAALTAQAEEEAKLAVLPRRVAVEAEGEALKETAGTTAKKAAERQAAYITEGLSAADSMPVINRAITLLDSVQTGGLNAAKLAATNFFGVTGADEGELSGNLGKAVLSQLRATFGAAFTEKEGERLIGIEAGFGKSPAVNKRLLGQAKTIVERSARRGAAAARAAGDDFSADEIESALRVRIGDGSEAAPRPSSRPALPPGFSWED